ncbi:MAG: 3-deoxy-7-phosphoheptulonate synthase [Calditrichaeota bacterium]|nr:MAG: 3-deoxy-7-phosphoheptulonate synthase [Calditrichota bacterium]
MGSRKVEVRLDREWLETMEQPLIIAGPCSAESREQVLATAREVARIPGVTMFRAGIWKPRTRPHDFAGVGKEGLGWLREVREETGLKVTLEVANGHHVYEALKYGIDVLWIGARTTVSPFAVQEIADALQGADVTVWVKNPMNPDLQLWIGALERLNNAGITRLGAIHRGFSTYEKTVYRNAPRWEIPIELKRQLPDLPLLCDPSHIAGNRTYLGELSQTAFDLAMNGLMIETHIHPGHALSDAKQQITPDELSKLLKGLRFPTAQQSNGKTHAFLEVLRQQIDFLDHELLEVISRRVALVERIGEYKKEQNMTILQVKRWEQVLEDRLKQANLMGLDENVIKQFYQIIHQYSIAIQSRVMNEQIAS